MYYRSVRDRNFQELEKSLSGLFVARVITDNKGSHDNQTARPQSMWKIRSDYYMDHL